MGKKKENVEEYVDSVDESFTDVTSAEAVAPEETKEDKISKQEIYLENLRKAKELSSKAKEEFKKTEYKLLRNDCYQKLDTVVAMVKKGIAISGIIYGKGGTGKTHRLKQLLKETNYEIIMSKLTAKALYCLLYEYREADIIWFDDVTKIMKDPQILGFLKAVCGDGNSEDSQKRIIQYNVSTPIKDAEGNILPSEFEITARILITTNEMPNGKKGGNMDLGAVLSRMKKAKLEIPRVEMLKIFDEIVLSDYADTKLEERKLVLDYIKSKTTDRMDLNLRILFDGFDYFRIAKVENQGEQWKINISDDLDIDPTTVFLNGLLLDPNFYTEAERIEAFNKYLLENGQKPVSKPTFCRKVVKWKEENGREPVAYKKRDEESSSEIAPVEPVADDVVPESLRSEEYKDE